MCYKSHFSYFSSFSFVAAAMGRTVVRVEPAGVEVRGAVNRLVAVASRQVRERGRRRVLVAQNVVDPFDDHFTLIIIFKTISFATDEVTMCCINMLFDFCLNITLRVKGNWPLDSWQLVLNSED